MRDEDKEFWVGRPEDREQARRDLEDEGWGPSLKVLAIFLAVWVVISLVATMLDPGDGLVFVLP